MLEDRNELKDRDMSSGHRSQREQGPMRQCWDNVDTQVRVGHTAEGALHQELVARTSVHPAL